MEDTTKLWLLLIFYIFVFSLKDVLNTYNEGLKKHEYIISNRSNP